MNPEISVTNYNWSETVLINEWNEMRKQVIFIIIFFISKAWFVHNISLAFVYAGKYNISDY